MSPITAITERDIDYFLIQVVNTYRGSIVIVKTGDDERITEAKVDQQGIQRIHIRNAGLLMRVSENGGVEIYRVSSPTANNKKTIRVFTLFTENLPFGNPKLLDAIINDDELLREFGSDLKAIYAALKQKPKFENKMDLSEAKTRLYRQNSQNRQFTRASQTPPAEKPVEKPAETVETKAETKVADFVPETPQDTLPANESGKSKKTPKDRKSKPQNDSGDPKAGKKAKAAQEKDREKEAEDDLKSVRSLADLGSIVSKK